MRTVASDAAIVVPAHRLLEPADVEVLDEAAQLERLVRLIALVRVDHQHEAVAAALARGAHPLGVLDGTARRRP